LTISLGSDVRSQSLAWAEWYGPIQAAPLPRAPPPQLRPARPRAFSSVAKLRGAEQAATTLVPHCGPAIFPFNLLPIWP